MKKRDIKMIGLDLDGTLLDSNKIFTEYTKQVITRAIEQGIIVLPATGRPITGIPEEVLAHPGIRYALTANGARVIDTREGKILEESLMSYEDAGVLMDIFREYDALLEVYYDGAGYADAWKVSSIESVRHYMPDYPMAAYLARTRRPVEDVYKFFREKRRPVDKVQVIFANVEERDPAMRRAHEALPHLELTGSLFNNIEANAEGVGKGKSLVKLGTSLGISREQIMACGDGYNDVGMLKEVGFGVAMANAVDAAKEAADAVTCSNDEDGVAKAIEKYVLKDEERAV